MRLAIFGLGGMAFWRAIFVAWVLYEIAAREAAPTGDNANLWPLALIGPVAVSIGMLGAIFLLLRRQRLLVICQLVIATVASIWWLTTMGQMQLPQNAMQRMTWLDGVFWPMVMTGTAYWLYQSQVTR